DLGDPFLVRLKLSEPLQLVYLLGCVGEGPVGMPEIANGFRIEVQVGFAPRLAGPQAHEQRRHAFGAGGDIQADRLAAPAMKSLRDGPLDQLLHVPPSSRSN